MIAEVEHLSHPPLVIPAKAGTQKAAETKWFFNVRDELIKKL